MKVLRVILSVCLLLQTEQIVNGEGYDTGSLNGITFECSKGFSFYDGNCYKAIDVPATVAVAYSVCLGQGSVPYYPRDEIEYYDYVAKLLPSKMWFGLLKDSDDDKWKILGDEVPLEMIPRWGNGQPDWMGGNATAVDPKNEVMIYDASGILPFVCKYPACLEGYMRCDAKCIPSQQVCNGLPECVDERDENNCPSLGTWYLTLSETTGSVQTQPMSDFEEQTWILEAGVGKRIRLYIPQMNLEENVVFLEVWTGSFLFQYSEMLGRFTGSVSSKYLYSTNHYLSIRFYAASDLSRNVGTYSFGWVTEIPSIPAGTKQEMAINNWKSISMPFTNEEYTPKNLKLSWQINANEGNVITYFVQVSPKSGFSVDDVKYELNVEGMEDSLSDRHYYTSTTNEVKLMSNYVPVNGHVTLRYKLGCGVEIVDTYGVIVSPHPVPNDLMCTWTLDAGEKSSRGMVLKFLTLNLAEDSRTNPTTRSEDKCMIYADKSTEQVPEIDVYKNDIDNIIHAPGGHFKVEFKSDSAFMSKGFTIAFGTDCEDLDLSEETDKSTDNTFYKENVELECPTGYKFHMEKYRNSEKVTLQCDPTYADPKGPGMWTIDGKNPGAIPECQEIYCGPPDKIQNGGIELVTGVTYNKVAKYFCNEGFTKNPEKINATCGEDGNWKNVPTCTSSQCSALSQNMLTDGKYEIIRGNEFTNNNADFDTVVEFSCNDGYELLGPKLSHCDSQGWTHVDNPPTCQKKTCPVLQIENSNVPLAGPSSPTLFEGTFPVSCNTGFKFKSGATGAVTLTCQANRTFDKTLSCEDIDECDDGSNQCNSASTTCRNNIGGYTCPCKTGFARLNDFSCTDIEECDNDKGGCSDTCVETDGSYECRCPTGNELYQSNGFQGFNLPAGETGLRYGDVFYIDHTCVAKQCPALVAVENGQYLSPKMDNYHFEDDVTLQCNDGYQVTDLTSTSAVSRCTADGTWDVIHTCEARKCTLPAVPNNGVYDKTEVKFGERLKLTCQLTNDDADKKELNAVCIYKDKDTGVGFVGDNITKCPEINCGDPELVMPTGGRYLNNVGPLTTTYLSSNSKFTFDCDPGYDVIGSSGDPDGDNVVKCKDNGRWSFGTLACAGKMCSDPGTLGDSKQVFDGYDIGSELYYTCDRDGFTVPDIKYICQYINGNAVWSNNLVGNLPECTDTTKPTFSGICGETKDVDAVDSVSFNTPTASDNFKLASITMTDNIRPGDRIITDTSVTYTATDFEGNTETCSVQFNIINRNDKPTLNCPDSKTFMVTSRNSETYDYTEDVTVTGGDITSVIPSIIRSFVDKIGTMELITITAANEFNTESSCTYMVHFVAGACFQEELFDDVNAGERVCVTEGNELVCTSTCRAGYMFSDKTTEKTFRCTGSGSWDYNQSPIIQPHDRYCLRQNNPQYDVPFTVKHRLSFLTWGCFDAFRIAVTGSVNTFRSRISNLCSQSWTISDVTANTVSNENFIYETTMKLTLQSSVTVAAADECIQKLVNEDNLNSVFVVNNNVLTCDGNQRTLSVETITNGQGTKNCETGYYLDGDICLQHGPAQYFDEDTNTVKACPAGQYQNGLAQTSCKECGTGQFPNSDQTNCQRTCPAGFTSVNGFYPCTPCQLNTYWTAKDECSPCPTGYSTVGLEGAPDNTRCYAPCPAGQYSRTGYNVNGCTSCPVNFYQDQTGQMTCKKCSDSSKTKTSGSTKSDDCIAITDVCNRDYCNGHGDCSFKRHRNYCTCDADSGYYGDRCQSMYHICDGNPCKNDGTCIRGATYKDYTCSCRTNLDTCEMKVSNEVKVGSQSSPALYQTLTRTLEQCKASCLSDSQCKEASSVANQICLLFNDNLQPADLMDEDFTADVHLKKECNTAYGGVRCEQDTKDDCENNNCNENSQCKDNINGFQCICPANGGFSGIRCDVANSPCNSYPCVHGTCTPFGSVRYECSCFDGYDGVNCDNNINDCANNPNACAYDGTCVDQVDSYRCQCKSGFGGINCENTPNFCLSNDCKRDNVCYSSLDRMEGVCSCDTTLFETRYRCEMIVTEGEAATAGKIVATRSVSDIEQCKTACQDNHECFYAIFNNALTPNCQMYDITYTGGQTEDSSFVIRKNCNNKPDVGYACDQVKVPCDVVDCNEGTCQNTNGNLDSVCSCKPGYTGSLCQHSIDDCIGNQCQNEAECIDGDQTYTCKCKDGFNGSRCENNINDCHSSCDLKNGKCEDRIGGYECICKAGYVGDDCEIDFNECSSNPCQHGGKCTDGENSFECECETGYTGDMCETMKDNCAGTLTCQNDGECISLQETSFCRCEGGATGDKCESATLLCKTLSNTDACINDGVCVNAQGTATCVCPVVYDKNRCYMEEGMDETGGGQVVNPKISTRDVNSADECKTLCLNNNECTAVSYSESGSLKFCQFYTVGEEKIGTELGSTHYRRNCPEDYKGKSCEIVTDWCTDNPCKNDGRCKQLDPVGYECECMPGYSGATCEIIADPCVNTPCLNRADCQATSLSTHDCLCTEGRTWTGTSCKNSRTDYTMLVNAADRLKMPASLQTLFHLKTNELSVMMWLRVHMVNSEVPLGTVFALVATEETALPENLIYDFSLTVSEAGIYVRYGLDEPVGISFVTEDLFGDILFDGEWHHLGISVTSSGMLSASLDSLHVQEPVNTGRNLQLDYNAQIYLGYGHVVEYRDVEVYNKFFKTSVFSKASTGGDRPDIPPVQSFQNYNLYPSTSMSEKDLESSIIKNPNLKVPTLNCEDVDDIYYATTERLVSMSTVSDLVNVYEQVKQKSGSTLEYMHTIESTITWGAYPLIIIGMDNDTKNYGQCSGKLIIRYNSACPAVNELFSDTVSYRQCSADIGGYCDVKCIDDSKVLAAPVPYYITCGTLGVYDYRMPYAETYYPACVDTLAVKYKLVASMKYKLETECSKTRESILDIIDDRVRDSFMDDIRPKWMGICVDDTCTNLKDITYKCDTNDVFNVVVEFSLVLTSMTLEAVGGGTVVIENALKFIIRDEQLIDIKTVSGAVLQVDTVVILKLLECPTGNRLDMKGDHPFCVPCSVGYYLNNGECMPCDYDHYQVNEAQTKCDACPDGKVTYRRGAKDIDECKVKCPAGKYYDKVEDTCVACRRNFYQHEEGRNFCLPCGNEYKTEAEGSDSEDDCQAICDAGKFFSGSSCKPCKKGTYKENVGDATFGDCTNCPDGKTTENSGADSESLCILHPTSNLPAILGGAIGGGGALLIIILIVVRVFMKLSRDSVSRGAKHETYHDLEHIQNGQNDGIYDTLNDYNVSQVDTITPYAIGYQDQNFEDETCTDPYRYRPSINTEDPGRRDEESRL